MELDQRKPLVRMPHLRRRAWMKLSVRRLECHGVRRYERPYHVRSLAELGKWLLLLHELAALQHEVRYHLLPMDLVRLRLLIFPLLNPQPFVGLWDLLPT